MATSSASLAWNAGSTTSKRRPRRLRRTATLIPVTLRLLDESGRHRIAEKMLGILTEISSEGLQVRVMGPSGRPLSRGLGRRQKVLVTFLATELHEKVESMVCELRSVLPNQGQPDAWAVVLDLPQLPAELAAEIFDALGRYAPSRASRGSSLPALSVALLVLAAGLGFWVRSLRGEQAEKVQEITRLQDQLVYSTQTVDRLASSLEEADRQLESQRNTLHTYEAERASLRALRDRRFKASGEARAALARRSEAPPSGGEASVRLRGASWEDFQKVQAIRGAEGSPRLAYVGGDIEMALPDSQRRGTTRLLTRLLGAFAMSSDVDLRALGAITLESRDRQVGLEPEEAFSVGGEGPGLPSFVFDMPPPARITAHLETYRKIGQPEVWLWVDDRLEVYRLRDDGYDQVDASSALPQLDLRLLEKHLSRRDQTQATRDFVNAVRAR